MIMMETSSNTDANVATKVKWTSNPETVSSPGEWNGLQDGRYLEPPANHLEKTMQQVEDPTM